MTTPAGPCSRWPCTPTSPARPRCATSPSAPACPSPTSSRSCWRSRAPAWSGRSGASAAATCWPASPRQITLGDIVSAVDGPIAVGDFGEPHQDGACDHEGQCVLLAIWADGRRPHAPPPRRAHAGRHRPDGPGRARVARSSRPPTAWTDRVHESPAQDLGQVGGQRRREATAARRVTGWSRASSLGVEERPRQRQRLALARRSGRRRRRVADRGQVHPDLVGAAGLEPAAQLGHRRPARWNVRTTS